jgi:hypothetical protein
MGFAASEPTDLDGVAYILIRLYGNGAMSISGNIGDKPLALQMLDHARDTVNNRHSPACDALLVPNRDVQVVPHEHFPLQQYADVPPELRPIGPVSL